MKTARLHVSAEPEASVPLFPSPGGKKTGSGPVPAIKKEYFGGKPKGSIPLYHFTLTYSYMCFDGSFRPVANTNG
jgi:hypothetical protein